jgi:molecular chaperone DnaK
VPQVQVSFDIDANGLLQVSATDRTTGRQQSVSIQGGSNLSEDEVQRLLAEAEQKATEDRRKRSEIDRRNRAQTLVAQAERRLRDAALELGPYGADRQQRAVELALRQVQDLLAAGDLAELEVAVSELQEALYGLNRRLTSERRSEAGGPLQGLKNTLGSLKDELFADDDWDDWDRASSRRGLQDPWRDGLNRDSFSKDSGWGDSRWGSEPRPGLGSSWGGSAGLGGSTLESSRGDGRDRFDAGSDWGQERERDRSGGRSFDRSQDQAVDWALEQQDNRTIGRSGDRWSERWQDGQGNQREDQGVNSTPSPPWDRPASSYRDQPSDPGLDRQPERLYGRNPEGDLDPYAGEGGPNPSYSQQRRGEPMAARRRPPQDDPWAEG